MKKRSRYHWMWQVAGMAFLLGILTGISAMAESSPAPTDSAKEMKDASSAKEDFFNQDHLLGFGDWDNSLRLTYSV